jgi:hypothetical protein
MISCIFNPTGNPKIIPNCLLSCNKYLYWDKCPPKKKNGAIKTPKIKLLYINHGDSTMKSKIILAALLLTTVTSSFARKIPQPGPNDPISKIEGLSVQKQEKNQWCWATVSRILISNKTSNLPSQCEIVSTVFEKDCCNENSVECNQPYYPEKALEKLGYKTKSTVADVNPDAQWSRRVDNDGWYQKVVNSIKAGTPVAISRYNRAGSQDNSAHVVVAYATYNVKNQDYLIIFDSWDGHSKFWDKTYVTGFQAWTDTLKLE